jgi:hypothetical protein
MQVTQATGDDMNGEDLKVSDELERSLMLQILYRGLQPVRGELAFVH